MTKSPYPGGGAWSASWAWKKMRPLFAAAGHQFFSPTYTGLGERAHLAHRDIDLSTHVQDVLNVLTTDRVAIETSSPSAPPSGSPN